VSIQGIVPEGEWDAFMTALATPLPATFRINGSGKFAAQLRDKLENDFFAKLGQAPAEVWLPPPLPPSPPFFYMPHISLPARVHHIHPLNLCNLW